MTGINMEYNKPIKKMCCGDTVDGFYVLQFAALKTSVAGKPYLNAVFADKDGSIEGKVWDYSGPISVEDQGKIVRIRGEITEFKGSLQFTAARIRLANEKDNYDLSELVPVAPIDREQTLSDVKKIIDSMTDEDYKAICTVMLERHMDSFTAIPAGKSVHHSFRAGLLMHTSNMLRTADFLADLYADVVDRSLLLAGTLLHDFAKRDEFVFSDLGLVTDYSIKGQLLGHLVMGANEIAEVAKELSIPESKYILLQHMMLSHHGEPEYGAAVVPCCAESELLSYIDLIDSRMEIYRENLADVPIGAFSQRIFALEKRIFHHE